MTQTNGNISTLMMIGMLAILSLFIFVDRDAMIAFANSTVMTVIAHGVIFILFTMVMSIYCAIGDTWGARLRNRVFWVALFSGFFIVLPLKNGQVEEMSSLMLVMVAAQVIGLLIGIFGSHRARSRKN